MVSPASLYCAEQGGTVELREETSGLVGYCHHPDRRIVVEEWEYFRTSTTSPDGPVGIANPASVFCEEKGGTVEIHEEAAGQVGFCHLPDGRILEEWAFFRSQTDSQTHSAAESL